MAKASTKMQSNPLKRGLYTDKAANPFERNCFKHFAANTGAPGLIATSYDGSPLAGKMTPFDEYNAGNGHRQKPKAIAVILDHGKDEDGDGATNIEDVKLFLKRKKSARTAL